MVFRRIINFHRYFWREFDREYILRDSCGWVRGRGICHTGIWSGGIGSRFDSHFSVSCSHAPSAPLPPRRLGGGYKGNRGASTHPDCPCKRNSSSIVRLKTPTIIQIILEHPQVVYTIKFNVHSYFSLLFIGSSRGYEQARHHWFPAYKLSTHILWVKTRTGKTTNTAFLIIHGLPV